MQLSQRAGILAGIAMISFAGCSSQLSGGTPPQPAAAPPPATEGPVKSVRTVTPERTDEPTGYPSNLYAEQDVVVTPRISGVIEQVRVDRGQQVRAGQPLAVLETDLAIRELEIAEHRLRLAEAQFKRIESLHDQQIVASHEYLEAEIGREEARSRRELARVWLDRCTVAAPFDGVVSERWAVVGQRVQEDAGTPLFRVVALGPHRARIDVPEGRLSGVRSGSPARIESRWHAEPFPARVVFVSPAIDPASGTSPLIVETDSTVGVLRVGALVRVQLDDEVADASSPLSLPREALADSSGWGEGETTVLVVVNGRARSRRVEIVGSRGSSVLVRGELKTDDQVIVDAGNRIADGDTVVVSGRAS